MRLLKIEEAGGLSLLEYNGVNVPDYAILSHTWGADGDEVTFRDFTEGKGGDKVGNEKIEFCRKQAERDGLEHFWIDTCCIDKSSSAELSEAINSMFHWYQRATRCYVFLSDVSKPGHAASLPSPPTAWEAAFRKSRWFSRGWTLQELIAPASVEFFSREGSYLGSKKSLEQQIHGITGIPLDALRGAPLMAFLVEERLSWTEHRETKRPEDKAYCLCGIFNIRMSLFYGEGRDEALARLRKKIGKSLNAATGSSGSLIPQSSRAISSSDASLESKEYSCARWCSCRCHRIWNLGSPQLFSPAVGRFSVSCVAERLSCNETRCKRRARSTASVTYHFPAWLTNLAIRFSLASSALSTQSSLKSFRIIPDSAEIFGAVSAGDLPGMQKLFQEGRASIHDVDEHNWTLLHRAFLLGKEDICKFLLTHGVDAFVEADNGSSVVERAWNHTQSQTKCLKGTVIYNNYVLTQVDIDEFVHSQQYTTLHKIILGISHLDLIEYLETSTNDVNEPDARGYRPLWWASVKGNEDAVRILHSYGADPNAAGGIMKSPLHVAPTTGIVRSLLRHNANVDARDSSGRTPLHCYSYNQAATNASVMEALIDGGASVNAKTNAGHTALHYAASFGKTGLIPVLLKHGISINAPKNNGDTALALAVRHNQIDAMRILLGIPADVMVRNKQRQNILHIGACFGRVETLKLLASCDLAGLSLSARDAKGQSAYDYFEKRQDRSVELEAAFDKLTACFSETATARIEDF